MPIDTIIIRQLEQILKTASPQVNSYSDPFALIQFIISCMMFCFIVIYTVRQITSTFKNQKSNGNSNNKDQIQQEFRLKLVETATSIKKDVESNAKNIDQLKIEMKEIMSLQSQEIKTIGNKLEAFKDSFLEKIDIVIKDFNDRVNTLKNTKDV